MMKRSWLISVFVCVALMACNSPSKRMEQARSFYEEGVRLREQRLSEEAADCFLHGLALLRDSENSEAALSLKGELHDNLGAMYLKHGLFEDAFDNHYTALCCFRQVNDSVGMMNAYRNCGRAVCSQEQFTQAKHYYDSAFRIATLIHDQSMLNDLYLEMGRDYYMVTGNFDKSIESVNQALQGGLDDNDTDIANMTLGILYYYTKDFEKARHYLNEALRSERSGLKMSVYQTLYAIAYNEDDYLQALQFHKLFNKYMMESEAENSSETLQRLKAEYELKAQKDEMDSLHRNRNLKLYLLIALAIIVLLVVLLFIRKKVSEEKIRLMEKELQMKSKVMLSNKVFVTAKNLGEHLSTESFNFELSEGDWADFISLTDLVYDGFSQRLLAIFPKLGEWDVRICCLCKNGFSNPVISILLNTQTDSYYKRKTRIKQTKMDLKDDSRSFEEIVNEV